MEFNEIACTLKKSNKKSDCSIQFPSIASILWDYVPQYRAVMPKEHRF